MEFETWFQNHFDDEIIEKHCHESTDRAAMKVAMKKLAEEAWEVSAVVANQEFEPALPLDIKIVTAEPQYIGWAAWFGDYDEGVKSSTGSTKEEAIMEMVENYRDWD